MMQNETDDTGGIRPMKGKISDTQFEETFHQLLIKYEQTGDEDDLSALILWTDRNVEYEKRYYSYRESAYRKLQMLEEVAELRELQLYRKAVLQLTLKRKPDAFALFMELIHSERTEKHLRERAIGYVLLHFEDYLRNREKQPLLSQLEKTEDTVALQLLEDIDVAQIYAEDVQADAIDSDFKDTEYELETECVAYTSDLRQPEEVFIGRSEERWRRTHRAEQYDLYLDFVSGIYYLKGETADLSQNEAQALARMAMGGALSRNDQLNHALYGEALDFSNRNRFDTAISRLGRRLSAIQIQLRRHAFAPGTTFCLLIPRSLAREWGMD
jgi:hypothetical protein